MFQYASCGLPDVWLTNGYSEIETPYGHAVSIENLEGLHKAIGLRVTESPKPLTGMELRFLRKELGLSQKSLGEMVGRDAQSIAVWEKGKGLKSQKAMKAADILLRVLYREHASGNGGIRAFIERLNALDRPEQERMKFEEVEGAWHLSAA